MSERNNRKKSEQEVTQKQLDAMAEAWCADNKDGRAMMFVSLSESRMAYLRIRGKRTNLIRLVREMILPSLMDRLGDWVITSPPLTLGASIRIPTHPAPFVVATHPRLVLSVQHQVVFNRNERYFV